MTEKYQKISKKEAQSVYEFMLKKYSGMNPEEAQEKSKDEVLSGKRLGSSLYLIKINNSYDTLFELIEKKGNKLSNYMSVELDGSVYYKYSDDVFEKFLFPVDIFEPFKKYPMTNINIKTRQLKYQRTSVNTSDSYRWFESSHEIVNQMINSVEQAGQITLSKLSTKEAVNRIETLLRLPLTSENEPNEN